MVVNNMIESLMYTGLTEYEARAYVGLLEHSPQTAYELAKKTGIPTSKVYEVLARMEDKSIAIPVEVHGKKKYAPQPAKDFLRFRKKMVDTTLEELEGVLEQVSNAPEVASILNLAGYEPIMTKARDMLTSARRTLLVSIWKEEAHELKWEFAEAQRNDVRIATVHFGPKGEFPGACYMHPIANTLFDEKGGRGIVIVADSHEALVGTLRPNPDGSLFAEGAYSTSEGFVTLAEDYIKHDIYMMKVVKRFDNVLKERFGNEYELLRNVFQDEERA